MTKILLLFILVFFTACEDKAIVKVRDKNILKNKCMSLLVFPPNKDIEISFKKIYEFKDSCELDLHISYKSDIVCNSNQNASLKAVGMPSGYLRLEIKEKQKLHYSYYIDLDEFLGDKQIQKAFSRLRSDLTH